MRTIRSIETVDSLRFSQATVERLGLLIGNVLDLEYLETDLGAFGADNPLSVTARMEKMKRAYPLDSRDKLLQLEAVARGASLALFSGRVVRPTAEVSTEPNYASVFFLKAFPNISREQRVNIEVVSMDEAPDLIRAYKRDIERLN